MLIRADVESLCTDPAGNGVTGVRLRDGKEIRCRRSVISSTGYFNTMNSLVPRALLEKYDVPSALPVSSHNPSHRLTLTLATVTNPLLSSSSSCR